MLKKLLDKIRHARFTKNRALSVNNNHKDTVKNMPAELQFVIPGIYISRASAESPNAETPKDMLRVYEESDTRENFFKTDAGREMSEGEILSNYLLYSAFESEKKTSENERKSKRLMRNFQEVELKDVSNHVQQEQQPQQPQVLDNNSPYIMPEEQVQKAVIKQTQSGPEITEFERSMLNQFVRIGEKVLVEQIELPLNYDFEKVRTATKLLGLDKKRISNYIAFFIMQQPYLYETLSRKIEDMLSEEQQQNKPEEVQKEEIEVITETNEEETQNDVEETGETTESSDSQSVQQQASDLSKLIDDYLFG